MNVFQIWDKAAPPCEPYAGYMRGVRDLADGYTLISPVNFMGANWVPFAEVWAALPDYMRRNTNGPLMGFDAMRALYLSRHFDHVYLDVDVQLLMPLALRDRPQADGPGVLIGNGDPVVGRAAWAAYLRMCPRFCRPASLMFSGLFPSTPPKGLYIHTHARGQYSAKGD